METSQLSFTIMFADISGSTRLYEECGDQQASFIINEVILMMTQVVKKNEGIVIKTIGDEVMCRFDKADDAVFTANTIQEVLANRHAIHGIQPKVRIGIHSGPALLRSDGDVFGDVVNVAARMASIAKAGQTLTTESTISQLSYFLKDTSRIFDKAAVKGKSATMLIYELVWGANEISAASTMLNLVSTFADNDQLELEFQGQAYCLSTESPCFQIGREALCDLVIDSAHASRNHAHIEYRRGKFVIVDCSTNGTFVRNAQTQAVYIRREELPLIGQGSINLGVSFEKSEHYIINYKVQN